MMSVSRDSGFELPASADAGSAQLAAATEFAHWYRRGEALSALGHYAEALRYFEEAIALGGDLAEALIAAAVCLIHLERPQEALLLCDRVLAQTPEHPQGWLFRGVALQRLGRHRQAYAAYQQASKAAAPQRPVRQRLGKKLAWLGNLF
jgi:tetratricopeptide (TPR) repeat protein